MNTANTAPHPALAPNTQRIAFPAGILQLTVDAGHDAPGDLLGFAARANPRRAFLFLSKVLGKHYPARPAAMEAIHRRLAAAVTMDSADNGPVVFIGMAETATGLGQGIHEAWRRTHRNAESIFLHTTRYRVEGRAPLAFEETHSHAPRLFLYPPDSARFAAARQAVLIDDELSTGNTFVNLAHVLSRIMPRLARVHLAAICDFMGEARRAGLGQRMRLPCQIHAALRGHWHFEDENSGPANAAAAAAQCEEGREAHIDDQGHGRLGRETCLTVPDALADRLAAERADGPTLVLGTGEFMHAAFVLARALAARSVDVFVQATTRSPILVWGGIEHALPVPDPYGEGVPNYLYNVRPGQYARVLVCHETRPGPALFELARLVEGRLIHFRSGDHAEEIPLR
ncbi:MAG: phosphoribosyltransferase family protein [Azoarcus sp.]|jgi:hypothetical protein|nr:phosphoribosyltransferase family protein [Azoarcus sp.]